MDHVITDNRAWVPTEIMVSAAIMAKADTEIDAALGREQAAGTIIYTAGYDQIKQKALDGSWVEVATLGKDTSCIHTETAQSAAVSISWQAAASC